MAVDLARVAVGQGWQKEHLIHKLLHQHNLMTQCKLYHQHHNLLGLTVLQPLMEFQNQPGCIGSKPNIEKPMGKFLPTPGHSLFSKGRQQEFQQIPDRQQMATTTLVRWDKPVRCSARFQNLPMALAQKQKLAHQITETALKGIGGVVTLQACINLVYMYCK